MKRKFFIKLAIHAVTLPLLYLLVYRTVFDAHQWMRTKNDPNAVYVIGDSRVVHGLDTVLLSERIGKPVHNYATHGMSVYNVYVLSEVIPADATVLVAPSLGMFARRRDLVTYESGLSVSALVAMWELGYEWWYFRQILVANRYPLGLKHFRTNREPYPLTDAPDLVKSQRFREIYEAMEKPPPRFERNEKLFAMAMENLLAKGCTVKVVEFPVTAELRKMRAESVFGTLRQQIDVLSDPRLEVWTDVVLDSEDGENLYYDMDHLNIRGRARITEWLASEVF